MNQKEKQSFIYQDKRLFQMTCLIVEENVIGVLSSNYLPEVLWANPEWLGMPELTTPEDIANPPMLINPFKNLIEFLDKTRGRWLHQNEVRKTVSFKTGLDYFKNKSSSQFGIELFSGPIYMSPYFDVSRLPISVLPQAFGMFSLIGMCFELVDYPTYVAITDANYDDEIPSFLPYSTTTDEQENVSNVTWRNWKNPSTNTHSNIDGINYISMGSGANNDVAGSVLVQLILSGYTVNTLNNMPQPT